MLSFQLFFIFQFLNFICFDILAAAWLSPSSVYSVVQNGKHTPRQSNFLAKLNGKNSDPEILWLAFFFLLAHSFRLYGNG